MASKAARTVMIVGGALAVGVGGVWIGQGLGLIPGSFMSGDKTWFYVGTVVVVAGSVLVLRGVRSSRNP